MLPVFGQGPWSLENFPEPARFRVRRKQTTWNEVQHISTATFERAQCLRTANSRVRLKHCPLSVMPATRILSHFPAGASRPRPTSTHRLRQLPSDSHLRSHSLVDFHVGVLAHHVIRHAIDPLPYPRFVLRRPSATSSEFHNPGSPPVGQCPLDWHCRYFRINRRISESWPFGMREVYLRTNRRPA